MKRHSLYFILLIYLCSCINTAEIISVSEGVLIKNVTVISAENGEFNPFVGQVLIDYDSIIYVGTEPPNIEGQFKEIDGQGKYLIPGLIDSHVHMTEVQGMIFPHMQQYPDLVSSFLKQMPRSYLYFGFTTLINLGGVSEEQVRQFNEQPAHPDLYHTGRSGAMVANGYPMNFAPEEYRFEGAENFIYLESEKDHIPDKFDPADHSPAAVVKKIKEQGGIAVKTYYETGFRGMPTLPVPSKEMMLELKEYAAKESLVLTVHANSYKAHRFLTEVDVDVIAHGMWLWNEYSDLPIAPVPDSIRMVLDQQIDNKIGYTPTLTVIEGEQLLADPKFLDDPELRQAVSEEMINWYKTEEGQWFRKQIFSDYTTEQVNEIYDGIQSKGQAVLKYLADHGGLILFGTDTPSAPVYANPPGYNGFIEIQLMAEAGLTPAQILLSATANNAETFHLDDKIGFIEIGKSANLLLLSSNPLETIDAFNQIEKVILNGRIIDRQTLSAESE